MSNILLPDYIVKAVSVLDEEFYRSNNIEGIIFDIDNTLVMHTEMTAPGNVLDYFSFLNNIGIKYSIVSNNSKERVDSFCRELSIPYYYKALKPKKKFLKKALNAMGVKADRALLVGDQLFTDILGGRRMGMLTVLVMAVGEDETGFVSFKRKLERRILSKNQHKLKEYEG